LLSSEVSRIDIVPVRSSLTKKVSPAATATARPTWSGRIRAPADRAVFLEGAVQRGP
jgi:hypothetical protein